MSLEALGAEPTTPQGPRSPRSRALRTLLPYWGLSTLGGLAGTLFWRAHPVLGFLDGAGLVGNLYAASTGMQSWLETAENLGGHVVATAGSLALSSHPGWGYVAGAVAAGLIIKKDGRHALSRFQEYLPDDNVIDVEVEPPKTRALVPQRKAA